MSTVGVRVGASAELIGWHVACHGVARGADVVVDPATTDGLTALVRVDGVDGGLAIGVDGPDGNTASWALTPGTPVVGERIDHAPGGRPIVFARDIADWVWDVIDLEAAPTIPAAAADPTSDDASTLDEFHAYLASGQIPDVTSRSAVLSFNAFRHGAALDRPPFDLVVHGDERGDFFESVRAGSQGQVSISTSRPGIRRGGHFHTGKVERFVVVSGEATLRLRRLFSDDIVSYELRGDRPQAVDIPTLTTHDIVNTGADDMVLMLWCNEHFDEQAPDTIAVPVDRLAPGAP